MRDAQGTGDGASAGPDDRRLFRRAKALVEKLHHWLARNPRLSAAYLAVACWLLRRLPASGAKKHIVNAICSTIAWPIAAGPARQVRLRGSATPLVLLPHSGLMDFRARFEAELDYEAETVRFLDGVLADIDTVVEIGANVGLYTAFFANRLRANDKAGHVFAFEPSATVYGALLDNIRVNQSENVSAFNAAISGETGFRQFYEPVVGAEGYLGRSRSSLIESHASLGARRMQANTVLCLDAAALEPLLQRGRTLIKIDAEGAEEAIMRALEDLICSYRADLVVEVLHGYAQGFSTLSRLSQEYVFFLLTDAGPVRHETLTGDATYRFRDYFLTPRERADRFDGMRARP